MDARTNALRGLSEYLLEHPELAFKEHLAHDACVDVLRRLCPEWKTTPHAYGMETAWEAVYSQGTGGRRVVFCSEYDALPDVGHACKYPYAKFADTGGHNLICIGGFAAALGAVDKLKNNPELAGEVVLLGTPAEEGSGSSNRISSC
jgi:metal-dependent amidase/aminoacylase/carboxypeptidase family protein